MKKQLIPFQEKSIAVFANGFTNKDAIILLHGNSMSSKIWQKQFENLLSSKYFLIACDLPGHGESDHLHSYSIPELANSIHSLIQYFNPKNYVLAGNSLGGDLILQASAHLNDCKGIMLINTPPIAKPPAMDNGLLPDTPVGMFFTKDCVSNQVDHLSSYVFHSGAPAFFKTDFMNTDGLLRQSLMDGVVASNYVDELEAIKNLSIPIAVVAGEKEKLVNNSYFGTLTIPTLWQKIHFVENAAHCPQWENPEAFDMLLDQFCTSV